MVLALEDHLARASGTAKCLEEMPLPGQTVAVLSVENGAKLKIKSKKAHDQAPLVDEIKLTKCCLPKDTRQMTRA